MSATERRVAWTIAGSDSGGGAGVQADLKTMNGLGVHGCTVVTAITAQNTRGVTKIEYPSPEMIDAQLSALADDLPPAAVKLGMLGNATVVNKIADQLRGISVPIVCDPVLTATAGQQLLESDAVRSLVDRILPVTHLLTPNVPEAEALLGRTIATTDEMEAAARDLLKFGPRSVLLKGGHVEGRFSQDLWTDGRESWWLTSPRRETEHTHGTGCTLSSAIAACLALGYSLLDSIVIAKAYVNQGVRRGGGVGQGRGPLFHGGWPSSPQDMPWMTPNAAQGRLCLVFADSGREPLGIYPIVDRAAWLERLLPLGVKTIQLRAKDLSGAALEREARSAVEIARRHDARLFINDDWRLALRCEAYGVHLGQEDAASAHLDQIARLGLRLGLSAYSYADVARACSMRPSYIAIGTIYATASKDVAQPPVGLDEFRRLRGLISGPVVAIGGITLDRGPELLRAGADGIAVISDIMGAGNPEARTRQWIAAMEKA